MGVVGGERGGGERDRASERQSESESEGGREGEGRDLNYAPGSLLRRARGPLSQRGGAPSCSARRSQAICRLRRSVLRLGAHLRWDWLARHTSDLAVPAALPPLLLLGQRRSVSLAPLGHPALLRGAARRTAPAARERRRRRSTGTALAPGHGTPRIRLRRACAASMLPAPAQHRPKQK